MAKKRIVVSEAMPRNAYVPRDATITSRIMSSIRSTENRVERSLRQSLFALGLRYRKNVQSMPGKPDIVFSRARVVVFLDGDYWHGRVYQERGYRALKNLFKTPNRDYWLTKIKSNVDRDVRVTQELRDLGWVVLRVWESDVRSDVRSAAKAIATAVRKGQRATRKGIVPINLHVAPRRATITRSKKASAKPAS